MVLRVFIISFDSINSTADVDNVCESSAKKEMRLYQNGRKKKKLDCNLQDLNTLLYESERPKI